MKVLAFDIAQKAAYSFGDSDFGIEDFGTFSCKNLKESYVIFNELLTKWKPDYVVWARATFRINAIRAQSRIEGVLLLAIERYDDGKKKKDRIKINGNLLDNKCKNEIVGNGTSNKRDTMDFFKQQDPDIADSMLFWEYFKKMKL